MLSSPGLHTLPASVQILHPSQVWETRKDCCVSGMWTTHMASDLRPRDVSRSYHFELRQ